MNETSTLVLTAILSPLWQTELTLKLAVLRIGDTIAEKTGCHAQACSPGILPDFFHHVTLRIQEISIYIHIL